MEPDSKYHKERRLGIARVRIPITEQTWEYHWERTLATASPEFPTTGHRDSPLPHGLVSLLKKPDSPPKIGGLKGRLYLRAKSFSASRWKALGD
jgi:hypothetical protein